MRKIFSKWIDNYFSNEEVMLLLVLLAAALGVILYLGQTLTPVFTSIILAFLMQGMIEWLRKRNVPHFASVLMVFTLFVGILLSLMLFIMPLVWKQSINLFNELPRMVAQAKSVLLLLPQQYPDVFSEQLITQIIDLATAELSQLGQLVVTYSLNSIAGLVALLIYVVLVPILVFFFLKDGSSLVNWWVSFLPRKKEMLSQVWAEMDQQIANYVRGKVIEIVIVGSVTYLAFALLGINYAALLGIIVGLSVLIPYIGAALVTLPVALIGFFQWGWTNEFWYLMLAYGIIQALDGNVLVPLLFSEAVNLHPVSIIIAVLVFGSVWGFWGVFFAIPLATLIKAILNAWPKSHSFIQAGPETD
ncbi:AI-2E family transporter [Amphritea japonica]|uniref:PerM family membrane protein n=1 Tax=Amphritea japonica ATCC BAA-1530 TaxID=1278309 RepID=A0A7R6SS76_9GAMM|nr:AI-2E family transporter [Amphritea japonica]BBB26039.1 PerM family membrane protein [Amphritea japonica ATCC BAA-1530]